MNRIPSLAVAAAIALAGATSVSTAQAAEKAWTGAPQQWTWPSAPDCKLVVQRVWQPDQGQPFHLLVKNAGNARLKYTIGVRVALGGSTEFSSRIRVDNANPGEVSERSTELAYKDRPKGSVVSLVLTSCSVRG